MSVLAVDSAGHHSIVVANVMKRGLLNVLNVPDALRMSLVGVVNACIKSTPAASR